MTSSPFLRLLPGAGVTPAEGSVKPTAGFTLNPVPLQRGRSGSICGSSVTSTGHTPAGEFYDLHHGAAMSSAESIAARSSRLLFGISAVSTRPGTMTESFRPFWRISWKAARVNAINAALVAA